MKRTFTTYNSDDGSSDCDYAEDISDCDEEDFNDYGDLDDEEDNEDSDGFNDYNTSIDFDYDFDDFDGDNDFCPLDGFDDDDIDNDYDEYNKERAYYNRVNNLTRWWSSKFYPSAVPDRDQLGGKEKKTSTIVKSGATPSTTQPPLRSTVPSIKVEPPLLGPSMPAPIPSVVELQPTTPLFAQALPTYTGQRYQVQPLFRQRVEQMIKKAHRDRHAQPEVLDAFTRYLDHLCLFVCDQIQAAIIAGLNVAVLLQLLRKMEADAAVPSKSSNSGVYIFFGNTTAQPHHYVGYCYCKNTNERMNCHRKKLPHDRSNMYYRVRKDMADEEALPDISSNSFVLVPFGINPRKVPPPELLLLESFFIFILEAIDHQEKGGLNSLLWRNHFLFERLFGPVQAENTVDSIEPLRSPSDTNKRARERHTPGVIRECKSKSCLQRLVIDGGKRKYRIMACFNYDCRAIYRLGKKPGSKLVWTGALSIETYGKCPAFKCKGDLWCERKRGEFWKYKCSECSWVSIRPYGNRKAKPQLSRNSVFGAEAKDKQKRKRHRRT